MKPTIYFAGKISKNGWRTAITGDDRIGSVDKGLFDPNYRIEYNAFFYGGPFFVGCDHGCNHVPGQHASANVCGEEEKPQYQKILDVNYQRIRRADLMFTYIDELDCFGTLIELGMALHRTPVAVGFGFHVTQRKELWMAEHCATRVYTGSPQFTWQRFAAEFLPPYKPPSQWIEIVVNNDPPPAA